MYLLIFSFVFYVIYLRNTNTEKTKTKHFIKIFTFTEKILSNNLISILFIFIISQIVQLTSLQIETLNWDINTFIVTSHDISRGNLPLAEQWENKGPLLFFLYYIPQFVFENSFLAIKLFNDFVFYILLLSIFFISKKISGNNISSLASVLFFILVTGLEFEGQAGYSEYYALIFIGLSVYIIQNKNSSVAFFLCGMSLGLSYLVTSSVLILVLFFGSFITLKFHSDKIKIFYFFLGLLFPFVLIFVLYLFHNETKILLENLFVLPFLYRSELGIFVFKRFIKFTIFVIAQHKLILIGIANLTIGILIILRLLKLKNIRNLLNFEYFIYLLIGASTVTFLIANKGYWHHIIYFYYFFAISIAYFTNKKFIKGLIYLNFLVLFPTLLITSILNIKNYDIDNYPIYELSEAISKNYQVESVLALSDHLFLYYFDKQNESFIIHPSFHDVDWLLEYFQSQEYITNTELYDILESGPDLITCNNHWKSIGLFCETVLEDTRYKLYEQDKVKSSIFIKISR